MPLTPEEGAALEAQLIRDNNEIIKTHMSLMMDDLAGQTHNVVAQYVGDGPAPGPSPSPSPSPTPPPDGVTMIGWPSNKTYTISGATTFGVTVPEGTGDGLGSFVVSPTGSGAGDARLSAKLSESPNGPPMPGMETFIPSSKAPRIPFTVTHPNPGYAYAVLMPGSTYYFTVTVLAGDGLTNIQVIKNA